ncbi:MAG: GDSL-type esterase/lipase family protein, partial [Flavisolibacter sp.]
MNIKTAVQLKNYFFVFIFASCFSGCASSKNQSGKNILEPSDLKPFGRYALVENKHLELISSAVHFKFSFEGKECQVFASLSHPGAHSYIQYELDGVYQKRIRIDGDSSKSFTISAPEDGIHTITIYKATEAHTGPVFIQKVTGKNLVSISEPEARLIEFIGNSITCGAAADPSEVPCGQGEYHDQHNAYYAYGPRLGRTLGVNYLLSSVSGIGIYRNWNSNGPAMPDVYEKTDFQANSNRNWNFNSYQPKVVSIALGTNDYSNGDGKTPRPPFDSASFVKPYIEFVKLVKSKNPTAQIALLSSPMINGTNRITLQNCLSAVKKNIDALYPNDKPVALHFFQPMTAKGCTGHPSVEDH